MYFAVYICTYEKLKSSLLSTVCTYVHSQVVVVRCRGCRGSTEQGCRRR